MLHSSLLHETVQLAIDNRVLILNSAADPFMLEAAQRLSTGDPILAEDNLASLQQFNKIVGADVSCPSPIMNVNTKIPPSVGADVSRPSPMYRPLAREPARSRLHVRHIPFHEYTLREAPATIDVAILNMLYQPSNAWMIYGLQVAAYALKPGGCLYVVGAKDRGVLSMAKRMRSLFGNLETLVISKGQRVVCSHVENNSLDLHSQEGLLLPTTFAEGKLDEGTRLLVDALEVHTTDSVLT